MMSDWHQKQRLAQYHNNPCCGGLGIILIGSQVELSISNALFLLHGETYTIIDLSCKAVVHTPFPARISSSYIKARLKCRVYAGLSVAFPLIYRLFVGPETPQRNEENVHLHT